jgi:hypothetical protein
VALGTEDGGLVTVGWATVATPGKETLRRLVEYDEAALSGLPNLERCS